MRDLKPRDAFGYGATGAGLLLLWVLLAGDVAAATLAAGLAVASAATVWVNLVES